MPPRTGSARIGSRDVYYRVEPRGMKPLIDRIAPEGVDRLERLSDPAHCPWDAPSPPLVLGLGSNPPIHGSRKARGSAS